MVRQFSDRRRPARVGTATALTLRMVRLTVALHAASAQCARDLLDTLRFLMARTRLDSGCLDCSAWRDADGAVHYIEEWATEPDMRRRVQSAGFTSLLGALETVDQPPTVQFSFVSSTRGLDYVAEVRGVTEPKASGRAPRHGKGPMNG